MGSARQRTEIMKTQFAVFRMDKGKGSGAGLGNHIDRVPGKEHTYHRADSNRKHLNVEFIQKYKDLSLAKSVNLRIENGYKQDRKIRKTAVRYVATILSGSNERNSSRTTGLWN